MSEQHKTDISQQATSIARAIDRVYRTPGRYIVNIDTPVIPRNNPLNVEISRIDVLQRLQPNREMRRKPISD